ncbi:MAG TPA: sigma-70 family RNA polymerase sigma factor, partial [Ilumatobacteraceae bacterium]|nr:sigma-70 family RNA polymerase sigma factor [Ilumatobacteraceae bacterium]
ELVASAQAGDRVALDRLLRLHFDRVHAVCRRIVGTSHDADDAAQEAMIRIVKGLHAFDGRSSFGTWAYRVASNTALDELRKRRRRPMLRVVGEDGDVAEVADQLAERQVEAIVERLSLDDAIAALPDDFRAAVVLRDVADLDYREISEVLDVPIGTVKSRIARGRSLLADRLGNHDTPDERPIQDTSPQSEPDA